jgi:hypothetical protein
LRSDEETEITFGVKLRENPWANLREAIEKKRQFKENERYELSLFAYIFKSPEQNSPGDTPIKPTAGTTTVTE